MQILLLQEGSFESYFKYNHFNTNTHTINLLNVMRMGPRQRVRRYHQVMNANQGTLSDGLLCGF